MYCRPHPVGGGLDVPAVGEELGVGKASDDDPQTFAPVPHPVEVGLGAIGGDQRGSFERSRDGQDGREVGVPLLERAAERQDRRELSCRNEPAGET